ncbi:hypothetical protein U0070_001834 [Myodes glareolus]|uniref:Uncharacterized protein n=1 Tax=Myodes glareolus TaxID=447135 RepID=A0AAW0IS22_MYOGA
MPSEKTEDRAEAEHGGERVSSMEFPTVGDWQEEGLHPADYDSFFESKESNTVFSFLGLKPRPASTEINVINVVIPFAFLDSCFPEFQQKEVYADFMLVCMYA